MDDLPHAPPSGAIRRRELWRRQSFHGAPEQRRHLSYLIDEVGSLLCGYFRRRDQFSNRIAQVFFHVKASCGAASGCTNNSHCSGRGVELMRSEPEGASPLSLRFEEERLHFLAVFNSSLKRMSACLERRWRAAEFSVERACEVAQV